MVAATATAAFVAALLVYAVWPEGESRAVAWEDVTQEVGPLTVTAETRRVFRDRGALGRYLRKPPPASIDFSREQVLLVSPGPRSSTGYELEIVGVRERDGRITVTVRERTPGLGDDVRAGVTYPFRMLALPAGRDVYVDWRGR